MIDIFQYSNMYTLSNNIQWLTDEVHVRDECGPYVTRPGSCRGFGSAAKPDLPQDMQYPTGRNFFDSIPGSSLERLSWNG
jgi:hypothetical protein